LIAIVLAVMAALAVIWLIATYNRFVRLRALTTEAWSGIDVQLKRRHDLLPNLVETIKGYTRHEQQVFEDLAALRSRALGAQEIRAKGEAENSLTQGLRSLLAVAEAYPDLKANQNFLDLQRNLAEVEEEIQLARRYYNGTIRNYNIMVESFPSMRVAGQCGFRKADYFEIEVATQREAPAVRI